MRPFAAVLLAVGLCATAQAQTLPGAKDAAAAKPEPPKDPLGRGTPRGTVLAFLSAARKGENALARQYLNTQLDDSQAEDLAHQLFVVLDTRLPARLAQVSDAPEGSRTNPLAPNDEIVGTVGSAGGPVDVVLERVARPREEPLWLFSARTLESVPALYDEIAQRQVEPYLPGFLIERRVAGVRLYEWLSILIGLPLFYLATVLLNRALARAVRPISRRIFGEAEGAPNALPGPARLLLLMIAARWLLTKLPFSLLVRQFLSSVATLVTIGAAAALLILITGKAEREIVRRFAGANAAAVAPLLRVGRRVVDVLVVFLALVIVLRRFGVDPTPVLAGLGVGGIAIALAAQKTLENVIAGASLIFDQAVRVGDTLRIGEITGTVEHIGLRSTRIRTPERTLVNVPNSQIANMSLETLSARDKFWFHPIVPLRFETSADQLQTILDGIRDMLAAQSAVERESVRVRFVRLSPFSFDVEISAYVFAGDWAHFLAVQERLLSGITEIVGRAGAAIALPSQTMYVSGTASLPRA